MLDIIALMNFNFISPHNNILLYTYTWNCLCISQYLYGISCITKIQLNITLLWYTYKYLYIYFYIDEWNIPTSREVARYYSHTNSNQIQWKPLYNVSCNSWIGAQFSIWSNCSGEKPIWVEWGRCLFVVGPTLVHIIYIYIYDIPKLLLYRTM